MEYKLSEEELTDLLTKAYRSGNKGEENLNVLINRLLFQNRTNLVNDPILENHHWEVIISPDMCVFDEETYVQEMGVPPPVVIGEGKITKNTFWRNLNGTFFRARGSK